MDDGWWLQHIFGQSLAAKANPDAARLAAEVPPRDALALMTRLFSNCGSLLAPFTDQQVAEGLVKVEDEDQSGRWVRVQPSHARILPRKRHRHARLDETFAPTLV